MKKNLVVYGLGVVTGLVAVPATKLGIKAFKGLKKNEKQIVEEIQETLTEEFELDTDDFEEDQEVEK